MSHTLLVKASPQTHGPPPVVMEGKRCLREITEKKKKDLWPPSKRSEKDLINMATPGKMEALHGQQTRSALRLHSRGIHLDVQKASHCEHLDLSGRSFFWYLTCLCAQLSMVSETISQPRPMRWIRAPCSCPSDGITLSCAIQGSSHRRQVVS